MPDQYHKTGRGLPLVLRKDVRLGETVDSTYNFNGALVAFRTDLIRRIDDKRGSDDANTAFEAIRRGTGRYTRRGRSFMRISRHVSKSSTGRKSGGRSG